MKSYTITVNGSVYDVTVEEKGGVSAPAATEAMKMENEVVAPQDGKVASINVASGAMVESGDVLATMD